MIASPIPISRKVEQVNRIEIRFGRVAIWTLVFTNTFFVSYFFARVFQWV